jgi:outer membrane lipoprotein carrier protein
LSRVSALAALLFLSCEQAFADAAAVTRLGELLGGMRRIEAAFRQSLLDEQGALLQESSGRVELVHPGRFRWETAPPYEQLVVCDGTTVWQYDPDLAQVVTRPLDRRADQLPSLLLSGEIEAVQQQYEIDTATAPGAERFVLVPRQPEGPFSRLALQFRDGRLERLEITDALGQRTEVVFAEVRALGGVPDARFRFEPPPDVDVIVDE